MRSGANSRVIHAKDSRDHGRRYRHYANTRAWPEHHATRRTDSRTASAKLLWGFAWLEDALGEMLNAMCGTPRASVFTDKLGFEMKCQKVEALVALDHGREDAREVLDFIIKCREASKRRNEALHSRHLVDLNSGKWQRLSKDRTTDTSASEVEATANLIIELYSECISRITMLKAEHQFLAGLLDDRRLVDDEDRQPDD